MENSEKLSCSICLDNLDCNYDSAVLNCSHIYHFSCILEWVKTNKKTPKCPLCITHIASLSYKNDKITVKQLKNMIKNEKQAKDPFSSSTERNLIDCHVCGNRCDLINLNNLISCDCGTIAHQSCINNRISWKCNLCISVEDLRRREKIARKVLSLLKTYGNRRNMSLMPDATSMRSLENLSYNKLREFRFIINEINNRNMGKINFSLLKCCSENLYLMEKSEEYKEYLILSESECFSNSLSSKLKIDEMASYLESGCEYILLSQESKTTSSQGEEQYYEKYFQLAKDLPEEKECFKSNSPIQIFPKIKNPRLVRANTKPSKNKSTTLNNATNINSSLVNSNQRKESSNASHKQKRFKSSFLNDIEELKTLC